VVSVVDRDQTIKDFLKRYENLYQSHGAKGETLRSETEKYLKNPDFDDHKVNDRFHQVAFDVLGLDYLHLQDYEDDALFLRAELHEGRYTLERVRDWVLRTRPVPSEIEIKARLLPVPEAWRKEKSIPAYVKEMLEARAEQDRKQPPHEETMASDADDTPHHEPGSGAAAAGATRHQDDFVIGEDPGEDPILDAYFYPDIQATLNDAWNEDAPRYLNNLPPRLRDLDETPKQALEDSAKAIRRFVVEKNSKEPVTKEGKQKLKRQSAEFERIARAHATEAAKIKVTAPGPTGNIATTSKKAFVGMREIVLLVGCLMFWGAVWYGFFYLRSEEFAVAATGLTAQNAKDVQDQLPQIVILTALCALGTTIILSYIFKPNSKE
jgi:hypothetical protein